MQTAQQLTFGSYRFDLQTGQLWRGKQEVKLMPKAAVLLQHMVEHAGQVVTKEELFQSV
jgi:DNA-binding winged helix-turn-helix (wHTH) protein